MSFGTTGRVGKEEPYGESRLGVTWVTSISHEEKRVRGIAQRDNLTPNAKVGMINENTD